jgi:hypothetical protein
LHCNRGAKYWFCDEVVFHPGSLSRAAMRGMYPVWQMNVAEKVILAVTILIALALVAIASMLLFRFTSPFEATVVSLLIVAANHAITNKDSKSFDREKSESKARAAYIFVALSAGFVIDLEALAAIVRVLIGAYL